MSELFKLAGSEEAAAVLTAAEDLLLSGVRLTLTEYAALDPRERLALKVAGLRVDAIRAAKTGAAAQGPLGHAYVLSEVDGGAAYAHALMQRGLTQLQGGGQ